MADTPLGGSADGAGSSPDSLVEKRGFKPRVPAIAIIRRAAAIVDPRLLLTGDILLLGTARGTKIVSEPLGIREVCHGAEEGTGTMQRRNRGDYAIAGCELVAEGADLSVQVLSLAAGQSVPWHYHSEITDSFVCLEGPMLVETRAPRHTYRLLPGERCTVPPKTAHYVHGEADGPCKFLIVQGVGVYDFVAVGG
jgi:quercetin dioxygenase-like cupin family protein